MALTDLARLPFLIKRSSLIFSLFISFFCVRKGESLSSKCFIPYMSCCILKGLNLWKQSQEKGRFPDSPWFHSIMSLSWVMQPTRTWYSSVVKWEVRSTRGKYRGDCVKTQFRINSLSGIGSDRNHLVARNFVLLTCVATCSAFHVY